jgi:hypothetical protein
VARFDVFDSWGNYLGYVTDWSDEFQAGCMLLGCGLILGLPLFIWCGASFLSFMILAVVTYPLIASGLVNENAATGALMIGATLGGLGLVIGYFSMRRARATVRGRRLLWVFLRPWLIAVVIGAVVGVAVAANVDFGIHRGVQP